MPNKSLQSFTAK